MTGAALTKKRDSERAGIGWRLLDVLVAAGRHVGSEKREGSRLYVMILPAMALISVLAIGVGYMIWTSFHSLDTVTGKQGGLSLDQYSKLMYSPEAVSYRTILFRTIFNALVVGVSAVALALPAAYTIVNIRRRSLRRVALLLLLVPFLMGETVRTIGWVLLIGKSGALSWMAGSVGLDLQLLGSPLAVWIGMVQVMFPLATLIMMPVMRRISPDLEHAALTMGARPWQVWTRIVIPLARRGIVGAALIVVTLSMTEYLMPRILGLGKGPFVANLIQQMYLERGNLNLGSALSAVLLAIAICMIILINFFGKERGAK